MKKFSILLLATLVLFTGANCTVAEKGPSAESHADAAIEPLISKVKKAFSISDEYDEFNVSQQQYGERTAYSLDWISYDEKLDDCYAVIEDNGRILSYSRYRPYEDEQKLTRVDLDKAKEAAMKAVKEVNPNIAAHVELFEEPRMELYMETIEFTFNRVENDIPYYGNNIKIAINRNDYEIDNYVLNWDYNNGEEFKALEFPKPGEVISVEQAEKAYRENIGMLKSLERLYLGNRQPAEVEFIPMWSTHPLQLKAAINAKDGELFFYSPENYGLKEDMSADTVEAPAENESYGLTEAELKEVENIQNVYSQNEAEQKLRDVFSIGKQYEVTSVNLAEDKINEDFIYHFNFRQERNFIDASISGKTLTILSYHGGDYNNEKEKLSYDEAKEIALEKINELAPDYADAYQLIKEDNGEKQPYYNFSFMRIEDDVWIKSDQLQININGANGKVSSFYMDYYTKDLPAFPNGLTKEKALDQLFKHYPLELQYTLDQDANVQLVYALNYKQPVNLDPKDGTPVNTYGDSISQSFCEYEDMDAIEHQEEIKTLCQYGIGFQGETFAPKATLLQKDFIQLFYNTKYSGDINSLSFEDMVKELVRMNILKEGEVVQAQEPMNKRLAVKMFIRGEQLEDVAALKDIYKNIFADSDRLKEDIGYFNIAFGQGIIEKDSAGYIHPDDTLTREEGAMLIYNYLFE